MVAESCAFSKGPVSQIKAPTEKGCSLEARAAAMEPSAQSAWGATLANGQGQPCPHTRNLRRAQLGCTLQVPVQPQHLSAKENSNNNLSV